MPMLEIQVSGSRLVTIMSEAFQDLTEKEKLQFLKLALNSIESDATIDKIEEFIQNSL